MNALQLITSLSALNNVAEAAKLSVEAGFAGNKDVYLAWGKEKGFTVADLNAAWKEATPAAATRTQRGFASDYYDWLAEAPRSEVEARAFIMGESDYGDTTANTKNHLTHYLNIWALCETVRMGSKVQRSIASEGKAEPSPKKASKKSEEVVETVDKELMSILRSVAKGEFKSKQAAITQISSRIQAAEDEQLKLKAAAMVDILSKEGKMADLLPALVAVL